MLDWLVLYKLREDLSPGKFEGGMTLPSKILQEMVERLREFEAPSFGKVKLDVELNYSDGQLNRYHLAAYPVETLKA